MEKTNVADIESFMNDIFSKFKSSQEGINWTTEQAAIQNPTILKKLLTVIDIPLRPTQVAVDNALEKAVIEKQLESGYDSQSAGIRYSMSDDNNDGRYEAVSPPLQTAPQQAPAAP